MTLSQNNRYYKLRKAGICTYCKTEKVFKEKGHTYHTCKACHGKLKAKSEKRKAKGQYCRKPYKKQANSNAHKYGVYCMAYNT